MKTTVLIKCRCGHTFRIDEPEVETIFVVTDSNIDEIKHSIDYECPQCKEKKRASGYFH